MVLHRITLIIGSFRYTTQERNEHVLVAYSNRLYSDNGMRAKTIRRGAKTVFFFMTYADKIRDIDRTAPHNVLPFIGTELLEDFR